MKELTVAITAASYSGNKGAAAMLQSSISQLKEKYGARLQIQLMSVYPSEDRLQCPHAFVTVIPAQPQRVLCLAFPCAVLYRMFCWCAPLRALLLKNGMLQAYAHTDLVIDEAGISFSDSRGLLLNIYAFACAAIPMLMGVPVVKYSQAMGPFHNTCNRFLAAYILPKMKLVTARGRVTYAHLRSIGLRRQARLYADGAFTMPPAPAVEQRVQNICKAYGFSNMAALSVSSVVAHKCKKAGIDYCRIMAEFAVYLNNKGYQVYLIANAARIHSKKEHNNDLITGDTVAVIYQQLKKKEDRRMPESKIRLQPGPEKEADWPGPENRTDGIELGQGLIWEHREMDAEEIRAWIGQCRFLVTSRFHAMVFALSRHVPVMLIGWSHKYQEVMEQFGLAEYAADYSGLTLEKLTNHLEVFLEHREEILGLIRKNLPAVQKSSRNNMRHISKILDEILLEKEKQEQKIKDGREKKTGGCSRNWMNHVIDLDHPDIYMGTHLSCGMGCAADPSVRKNAASGGMVTALLLSLLKNHEIDGAWVVKTAFTKSGELTYETGIATTAAQIREASSSVYLKIPMMAYADQLRNFDGRLAVVLTPCMMRAFLHLLEKDQKLREKIVIKIGLFCSGVYDKKAAAFALEQYGIACNGAKRLYYRRGHWRGRSAIVYEDGSQKSFSYTKSICAYKNAYFFISQGCLKCKDQFAECADISFGDVWLKQVKKDAVKYTGYIVRSNNALRMLERAQQQGDIQMRPMTDQQILRSQMRALTFKYRNQRWNHRLAGWLAQKNRNLSVQYPSLLQKVPVQAVYIYMCMIRALLSW